MFLKLMQNCYDKGLTLRNLSDETHRALRVRAAMNGRSPEAEIQAILESAVRPEGRVKLGTLSRYWPRSGRH